jgi:Fe-S cluster biosynthesis and repair protein YggX
MSKNKKVIHYGARYINYGCSIYHKDADKYWDNWNKANEIMVNNNYKSKRTNVKNKPIRKTDIEKVTCEKCLFDIWKKLDRKLKNIYFPTTTRKEMGIKCK